METRIGKWGNSLGIRLPVALLSDLRWREGSLVTLNIEGEKLTLTPAKPATPQRLAHLLEGITEQNCHHAVDAGSPVGNEAL